MPRDDRGYKRPSLGGSSTSEESSKKNSTNKGYFVKGGVQTSNNDGSKVIRYDQVKESHYTEKRDKDEPDSKKSKLDEVHDEEYQKKLFTAAREYTNKKYKQDLMDNIHRWNWKVRKGEKSATIKANDIKGFLYIWCNQRRCTPEWEYSEKQVSRTKKEFTCELTIAGLDKVGVGKGPNKKEAQSNSAWDLCNWCAGEGLMDTRDFPSKEKVDTNAAGCIPTDWKSILTDEHIKDAGGWNPENCQKRLQTFCSMEKVSCEIVNSSMGPDHAKIQISELKITLKKYGKEFYAKEQARTKKCGNSLVCWSIVKQLFKAEMIEKCGEKIKRPGEVKRGERVSQMASTIDEETGDWTLDTARQKLHEYLAYRQLTLEYEMSEKGPPSERVYIAELNFELDGKRYKAKDSAPNKKSAQKKVALDIVVRLFKEKKISANIVRPGQYVDPRRPFISGLDPPAPPAIKLDPEKMTPRERDEKCCQMKVAAITPEYNFNNATNLFVDHVEKSLKEISDALLSTERAKDENKGKPDDQLRNLCGMMRVGSLAAQMNLKGEDEFLAVLMMLEKPTYSDITSLSAAIESTLKKNFHENYKVTPVPDMGGIEMVRQAVPRVTLFLSLSSTKSRPGPDGDITKNPNDKIDTLPAEMSIRALADLRRAKWYNVHYKDVANCLQVCRLIRDMSMRVPTWQVMTDWHIQLLVYRALISDFKRPHMKIADAMWRVFSVVAGGLLLPGGEGLLDPCERDGIDAVHQLSEQEREDITTSAQHALRLIAFGQFHKVLGMPPLADALKEAEIKAKLAAKS